MELDLVALWVGRATLCFGGIIVVGALAYWSVDVCWRALRSFSFGRRVITEGLKVESARLRKKRSSLPA